MSFSAFSGSSRVGFAQSLGGGSVSFTCTHLSLDSHSLCLLVEMLDVSLPLFVLLSSVPGSVVSTFLMAESVEVLSMDVSTVCPWPMWVVFVSVLLSTL